MEIIVMLIKMKKIIVIKPKPDLKKPVVVDLKSFNNVLKRVISAPPMPKK